MISAELLVHIKRLSLGEKQQLADEILRDIAEEKSRQADQSDWPTGSESNSLISPEDEKNIQRIWKTFGSC